MTDLKPSPCCGEPAELIYTVPWHEDDPPVGAKKLHLVRCSKCHFWMVACETEDEAIRWWNEGVE